MDEFGKKIAAILDAAPLEKRIEDRLAQARSIALSRAKQSSFIEVTASPSGVLKIKSKTSYFNDNLKWLMFLTVGIMVVLLQQGYNASNQESETVQYLSNDYVQYQEKLNLDQENFYNWKIEINNLINKDDN